MYTHMLTYHTYSTIASQPRIYRQIPLYQYAYNDLSGMFRDPLQIPPNTLLHIHMQIAQPHTSLTPPHTLTQLHTHATCTIYVCMHACMCVLYLLCWSVWSCGYHGQLPTHCLLSLLIFHEDYRTSPLCLLHPHSQILCCLPLYSPHLQLYIQTHASDTTALSYEHIRNLSFSLRSWNASSIR